MAVSSSAPQTVVASDPTALNRLLFFLALLPMVLIAAIINHYGVNVPYGDEWSVLGLIGKWDSHQLTLADFYRAHNGHRILIPRLIYLALTQLIHGNLRAEMFFSLFLCVLTSAGIYLLLRRTVSGSTAKRLTLWALINLFLFSPIQAENWLWGFQLQVFLSNLCIVGAIVCITSEAGLFLRMTSAAAFAVAGTFSFGNGLLIWPLILLLLFCRSEKVLLVVTWIAAAALVFVVYLPGYRGDPSTQPVVDRFDYLLYVVGFLGTPLARIPNSHPLVLPIVIGSILVVAYLIVALYFMHRRDGLPSAAPWLALGAYALGSAMLVAIARAHFGLQHALDSRYTTISVMLLVSLIGLGGTVMPQEQRSALASRYNKIRIIVSALVACLLSLSIINAPSELFYLRLHHGFRSRGKAALEFSSVLDLDQMIRKTLLIREDPETLARYLSVLDRLGLSDPPRRQTSTLSDAEDRPKRATDEYGIFESVEFESENVLAASGWSYLPAAAGPSAAVLLAYRSNQDWKAFALCEVTGRRPDLASRYKGQSYFEAGWRLTFPRSLLPPGKKEISAWALEANHGRTYRLPGSFGLEK